MNGFQLINVKLKVSGVRFASKPEFRDSGGTDRVPEEPSLWLHISAILPNQPKRRFSYVLYRSYWDQICNVGDEDTRADELEEGALRKGPAFEYLYRRATRDIESYKDLEDIPSDGYKINVLSL